MSRGGVRVRMQRLGWDTAHLHGQAGTVNPAAGLDFVPARLPSELWPLVYLGAPQAIAYL